VLRPGTKVDIVNVFRQPSQVDGIVDRCLALGLPALWLQLGVVDEAAANRARAGGMTVVMDRCIYVDRAAMG
jgi:predicted CoA-binding protein